MVGEGGLEPPRLAPQDPKSCVSANFTTRPEGLNRLKLLPFYCYLAPFFAPPSLASLGAFRRLKTARMSSNVKLRSPQTGHRCRMLPLLPKAVNGRSRPTLAPPCGLPPHWAHDARLGASSGFPATHPLAGTKPASASTQAALLDSFCRLLWEAIQERPVDSQVDNTRRMICPLRLPNCVCRGRCSVNDW